MFEEVLAALEDDNSRRVIAWVNAASNVDEEKDDAFGATLLQWACHWNNVEVARALLQKGASANLTNNFSASALHWAVKADSAPLVKLLMSYGGDVNLKNDTGDTPVSISEAQGTDALTKILTTLVAQPEMKPIPPRALPSASTTAAEEVKCVKRSDGDKTARQRAEEKVKERQEQALAAAIPSATPTPCIAQSPSSTLTRTQPAEAPPSEPGVSVATLNTLQRSKVRAEMELENANKTIEEMRVQLANLSKDNYVLQAKVKTFDELKKKLDTAQKENMRLQFDAKQNAVDEDCRRQLNEEEGRSVLDVQAKAFQGEKAALKMESKRSQAEIKVLQAEIAKVREDKSACLAAKEQELEAVKGILNKAKVDNIKLEVAIQGMEGLREEMIELRKDKALLECDIQKSENLERELDRCQAEKSKVEMEAKRLLKEVTEWKTKHDGIKAELELMEQAFEHHNQVLADLDMTKRELAKTLVKLGSAQEEIQQHKDMEAAQATSQEEAMAKAQETIGQLQGEKAQLLLKIQEREDEVSRSKKNIDELNEKQEMASTSLAKMNEVTSKLVTAEEELKSAKLDLENRAKAMTELQNQHVELLRKHATADVELNDLRDTMEAYNALEAEAIQLRVDGKHMKLQLQSEKEAVASLTAEKMYQEEQNKDLLGTQSELDKLKIEHELVSEQVKELEAEVDEYRSERNRGVYKQNKDVTMQVELLQRQAASLQADVTRVEMENRVLHEEIAQKQSELEDLESERLEFIHVKEKVKELERVSREKANILSDYRHLQEVSDEMQRQKRLAEDSLKDKERLLHAKDLDLDSRNRELRELQHNKDVIMKDVHANNTDLKIQIKDLEARLRETERGRAEEYRVAQGERENLQREYSAQVKQLQQDCAGLRQRLMLMQKERSGLDMQLKALQEATLLGPMETMGPLSARGTTKGFVDEELMTTTPAKKSLPPVQHYQQPPRHMPRPPQGKKEAASTWGSHGNGNGSSIIDDYSGFGSY